MKMTVVRVDSVQMLQSVQQSIILILILFIISSQKLKLILTVFQAVLYLSPCAEDHTYFKFIHGNKINTIYIDLLLPTCCISIELSCNTSNLYHHTLQHVLSSKQVVCYWTQSQSIQLINLLNNIISITTNMKPSLVVLLLTLYLVHSAKVVDLFGKFTNFPCLIQNGYYHSIVRAYHSYGAIDTDAPALIQQSNKAGLSTDVYMFPCRGKNATVQVNELIDYLEKMKTLPSTSAFEYATGTIWLDIETNPSSGCSWSIGTPQSNCQYVKELIAAIEARGRAVGIYASAYMWNQIFGSRDACASFTSYPIWYAHYDGKQDFNDWQTSKFAGWTTPSLKQYAGDSVVCGYKVDLSYY